MTADWDEELTSEQFDALLASGMPADVRVSEVPIASLIEDDEPEGLDGQALRDLAAADRENVAAAVEAARAAGYNWTSIGEVLSIDGARAFERYGLEDYLVAHPEVTDTEPGGLEIWKQAQHQLQPPQALDVSITLHFSGTELETLLEQAKEAGMGLTDYMRTALLRSDETHAAKWLEAWASKVQPAQGHPLPPGEWALVPKMDSELVAHVLEDHPDLLARFVGQDLATLFLEIARAKASK